MKRTLIAAVLLVPVVLVVAGVLPVSTLSLGVPVWAWLVAFVAALLGSFVAGIIAGRGGRA